MYLITFNTTLCVLLSPPLPPSGGHQGSANTDQVEKLLQHPPGAAGAQAAHDDEREQQALPAT